MVKYGQNVYRNEDMLLKSIEVYCTWIFNINCMYYKCMHIHRGIEKSTMHKFWGENVCIFIKQIY